MNSIDELDNKQKIIKYGKYVVILIIIIAAFLFIKGCKRGYSNVESDMVEAAKKYISDNGVQFNDSIYIDILKLGEIEGTELCSRASGVIATRVNGKITYKPYLKCDNYETKLIKNKNKCIIPTGDEVVLLTKGEAYEEKYYTLTGDADVVISGNVGTNPGLYTVAYTAYCDTGVTEVAYRQIIVTENDKNKNISELKNREEPTLTLNGDTDIVLSVGEKYREPGYTAIDYEDGKISRKVVVNPDVKKIDSSKPNYYELVYSITNSKGLTATAKRYVTIVQKRANLNINISKSTENLAKSVDINIKVSGEKFSSIDGPNGITYTTSYNYKAKSNGIYTFYINDTYGNKITKKVDIDNIDNIPPNGTCSALVIGSNTDISVNASDDKGIKGYIYVLDGKENDFVTTNTYRATVAAKKVAVKVQDLVGNESTINCTTTIKEETTVSGRVSGNARVIDTSDYLLVSTKNDVIEFAKIVDKSNIAQTHPPGYGGYCLSFAYYHSYLLYNGSNLNSMTAEEASKYTYAGKFQEFKNDDKQVVLAKIYELIKAGQPLVLHVNGNAAGTSRHYVSVVGFKKNVTSGNTMKEEDLLILDSHSGKLERMDTTSSRFMITGYATGRTGEKGYGYQLYILR